MFLLLLFAIFVSPVVTSKLNSINPYDGDPYAKYYLMLGCRYLTHFYSGRYEARSTQGKLANMYSVKCARLVWPDHTLKFLPAAHKCSQSPFRSFKKGDLLTHYNRKPAMVAHADGFFALQVTSSPFFLFYHPNKPLMNLDVLTKLSWPLDKDLLTFRDLDARRMAASMRGKPSSRNVAIKYRLDNKKTISFGELKSTMQTSFDIGKHNFAQLNLICNVLRSTCPNIRMVELHKPGVRTHVEPLFDPFALIPPRTPIALRYNPETFTLPETLAIARYSTVAATFEHEGSRCCLLLSLDTL